MTHGPILHIDFAQNFNKSKSCEPVLCLPDLIKAGPRLLPYVMKLIAIINDSKLYTVWKNNGFSLQNVFLKPQKSNNFFILSVYSTYSSIKISFRKCLFITGLSSLAKFWDFWHHDDQRPIRFLDFVYKFWRLWSWAACGQG